MKRQLIRSVLILGALTLVAHVVLANLSFERLRPTIEAQLSEALGLAVAIEGGLSVELLPALEIQVGVIKVANLPDRPSPYLLEIGELQLHLELRPLLRRVLAIDEIEIVNAELRIEPDEAGGWALRSDIEEFDEPADATKRDPLEMRVRRVVLRDSIVFYHRAGSDEADAVLVEELELENGDLDSAVALSGRGEFEGANFWLQAQLGSIHELLAPTQPFPIELRGEFLETELQTQGTLQDPTAFSGVALRFEAEISDLSALQRDPDRVLPPLGRVQIAGLLEDPGGTLGVRDLRLRTGSADLIELVVEGAIADIVNVSGVDVQIRVETPNAELFEPFATISLPRVPAEATLEISDEDGSLGIEGEAHTVGAFDLDLRGALDDLRRLQELNVQVQLGSKTLASIPDAFGLTTEFPIPAVGPLQASGQLVDRDGVFGIDAIDLRLGGDVGVRASVTGSVRDAFAFRGLELRIELEAPSAKALAALHHYELPDVGALSGFAVLSDSDGSLGIERATARLEKRGQFELSLSGVFDDLRELDELEAEAELQTQTLAVLADLFDIDLPALGPATFRGTLRGSDEQLVSTGSARIGQSDFHGELTARFASGQRPSARARLKSPHLHLVDLGIVPGDRPRLEPKASRFDVARWWRGEQAFDLDALRSLDLDIGVDIELVTGRELLEFRDVHASLLLEDGKLRVADLSAGYQRGRISGDLELDAGALEPKLAVQLEAFNVDLGKISSQFETNSDYGGLLDLSIDLKSRGATGPEVIQNLSGRSGAMLRNGAFVSRYSRAFSVNFLRVSIPSFRRSPQENPPVRCLFAMFDLEDGVAQVRNLYLEGLAITITGAGHADLANRQLDLRLTPHVHEPGLVSVAATVDVSGSLANPTIRAVRRSLGASAARALFRNAMRPARAVRTIARRGDSEAIVGVDEPCDLVALKRMEQMETDEVEAIDLSLIPVAPPAAP